MKNRRNIVVTYSDGDTVTTWINGTEDEIRSYFAVGQTFNLGRGEHDRLVQVVSVEIE